LLGTYRDTNAEDRDTKGRKVTVTSERDGDAVDAYMDEFAKGTIGEDVYLTGNSKADEHLLNFKEKLNSFDYMKQAGITDDVISDLKRQALTELAAKGGPQAVNHMKKNIGGPRHQDIHVAGDKHLNGPKWRHDNDDQAARLDSAIEDPDANMADAGAEIAKSIKAAKRREAAFAGKKGAKNYPELPEELRTYEKVRANRQRARLAKLEKRRKAADAENARQDKLMVDESMGGADPLNYRPEPMPAAPMGPRRDDDVTIEWTTDMIMAADEQDDEYEANPVEEKPIEKKPIEKRPLRVLGSR